MQSIKSTEEILKLNTDDAQADAPPELELMDLKLYRLGTTERNARRCSHEEFVGFAQSIVRVEASNLRTVFQRRDFLNWCLEQKLLRVEDDRLVIVEKELPTKAEEEKEVQGVGAVQEGNVPGVQSNECTDLSSQTLRA